MFHFPNHLILTFLWVGCTYLSNFTITPMIAHISIFSFSCLETFSGSLLYRAEPGNCVLWTDLAHRHILFGPCREYLNWLSMSKSWEFTYKLGFLAYLEMLKTLVTLAGIPACSLAERSSGCPFCKGCVLFHYHCFTLPALIFIEGKFTQHKINHLQ